MRHASRWGGGGGGQSRVTSPFSSKLQITYVILDHFTNLVFNIQIYTREYSLDIHHRKIT